MAVVNGTPGLRTPRAWEEGGQSAGSDDVLKARVLGLLFLCGAALALVAILLLPLSEETDELGSLIVALAAVVAGVLVLALAGRLPAWSFHVLLAGGTAAVSVATLLNGEQVNDTQMLYLWVSSYAFYFFKLPAALVHAVLIAAAYAGILIAEYDEGIWLTGWTITVGTMFVTGLLLAKVRTGVTGSIARLAAAARTDALTGLLNRRGFERLFDVEIERARRSGLPLALLVGDLDGFKHVNDTFGHQAGDEALVRVSRVIERNTRKIDTPARIGGEEFAVIVPQSDEHGAHLLAERLRRAVDQVFADGDSALTISLGVAAFPAHGDSTHELLSAADQALYAAKARGRNRSEVFASQ